MSACTGTINKELRPLRDISEKMSSAIYLIYSLPTNEILNRFFCLSRFFFEYICMRTTNKTECMVDGGPFHFFCC